MNPKTQPDILNASILDAIGNTPLVPIKRLNPNPRVRLLAKLEYFNPGGSIKDRPALYMIEAGENSGQLTRAKTVIEATSGNTGIGLALICAVKGYKLLLTMSEAVSQERQKILKARGAEILLTPGHLGTDGAIEEAYRLAREHPDLYFMTDQYNNEANWKAHYVGTAEEVWRQTGGEVTRLVATMGTSGTLMGMSRRLKELNPGVEIVGVEPYLGHKIQGLKNMKEAYVPELFDKKRLDRKVNIDDEEAYEMARRLAREEGLLVGMSSGAAMVIAAAEAAAMEEGTLVVIFPDGGERYLSTPLFNIKEKASLQVFNTLSRSKQAFEPLVPGKVSVYSCGPTAHARMHLGECRRFVFADLLCRYLEYRGHAVTHIMNITDFDDKTIQGSEKAGMELADFTKYYIDLFQKDLELLRIDPATRYPRASEHLADMAELAENLARKGYAYEKLRSLYFDISRLADYGRLSGVDVDKIKIGATVDLDEYEKDNPRDFTLFKRIRLSELKRGIFIKTPWGNVRPSWHIQCAAMSMKYLGETFDIHTSSRELVFPHHENEMAIAAAVTGKPLARYWMHCDRVLAGGKKMDEAEDRITLQDLLQMGYSGRQIRFWLLSCHYRKPLTFSAPRLEYTSKSLMRLDSCIRSLRQSRNRRSCSEVDQLIYDLKQGVTSAMDDDLNISAALASIYRVVKKINSLLQQGMVTGEEAEKLIHAFARMDSVFGIFDFQEDLELPEVQKLLQQREIARKTKNFALADQIRNELEARGLVVQDSKLPEGAQ